MERALEQALEGVECATGSAQQTPPQTEQSPEGKSLYEKLYNVYVERGGQEPGVTEELRDIVNLLEKLVRKELLACLLVSVYPGKGGYSVILKGEKGSSYLETINLPYEVGELLDYLHGEELPPILEDILEDSQINIFYWGCVVTEIQDYRFPSFLALTRYQSRYVLLHATMKTFACDQPSKTSENQKWTQQDKVVRESQLLLTTAEPLCLGLPISGAEVTTGPMKRGIKRCCSPSLSGQEELSLFPSFPELKPLPLCHKTNESEAGEHNDLISNTGNCVDMWQQKPCDLNVTSEADVEKYAEELEKFLENDDPYLATWPIFDKDFYSAFDWESGNLSKTTELDSVKPLDDPVSSGKESSGKEVRGETQLPFLQNFKNEHSVFSGFKELVQKNLGSCPCQMCHSSSGSASLSQPSPGSDIEQPETVVAQASVLGEEVTQPPPGIMLSSSSSQSSSHNSLLPQQASSSLQSPAPAPARAQESSVEVNKGTYLLATTLPSTSSSQNVPATQAIANCVSRNIIREGGHVGGDQAVLSGPRSTQGSSCPAWAPAEVKPDIPPSEACPQNAAPTAPQPPSQVAAEYRLINDPGLKQVILLRPYSMPLNTQQQQLYQLVLQQQLQQPRAPAPQQPVPPSSNAPGPGQPAPLSASAQPSTTQATASTTLLTTVMDPHGRGGSLHPQEMLLLPADPHQQGPQQQNPQRQVLWRILQHSMSGTTVGTETSGPPQGLEEDSQLKGNTTGDPPAPPKS
ncbi:transcription factor SPT20 homolog isoform X1 [Manis javanica]|uniref:transcription factor SPT20 homolog isoform X1 n=1 Tax=Manis javanica TaxID=9974 RepID=UPI003C6D8D95